MCVGIVNLFSHLVFCIINLHCGLYSNTQTDRDGIVFNPQKKTQWDVKKNTDISDTQKTHILHVNVLLHTDGMENDWRICKIITKFKNANTNCKFHDINLQVDSGNYIQKFFDEINSLWLSKSDFNTVVIHIYCAGYTANVVPRFILTIRNEIGNVDVESASLINPLFHWHPLVKHIQQLTSVPNLENVGVSNTFTKHIDFIRTHSNFTFKEIQDIKSNVGAITVYRSDCSDDTTYTKHKIYRYAANLALKLWTSVKNNDTYEMEYNYVMNTLETLSKNDDTADPNNTIYTAVSKAKEDNNTNIFGHDFVTQCTNSSQNCHFIFYLLKLYNQFLMEIGRTSSMWGDKFFNGLYSTDKEYLLGEGNLVNYSYTNEDSESDNLRRNRVKNLYDNVQDNANFNGITFKEIKGFDYFNVSYDNIGIPD